MGSPAHHRQCEQDDLHYNSETEFLRTKSEYDPASEIKRRLTMHIFYLVPINVFMEYLRGG